MRIAEQGESFICWIQKSIKVFFCHVSFVRHFEFEMQMKCDFHPFVDAIDQCESCRAHLCGVCTDYSSGQSLCGTCVDLALLTERHTLLSSPHAVSSAKVSKAYITSNSETESSGKPFRFSMLNAIALAVILACLGAILARGLNIFGFDPILTPEQIAAEERAKESLEFCIGIFWEIAELLERGETPDSSLRCEPPAGANIIVEEADTVIVRHPNPELYDLTEFYISSDNLVPTLAE
jgi:hypothetical protein